MDADRKLWNDGQQILRRALLAGEHHKATEQFLVQHAMVHSRKMSRMDIHSFEDDLWQGLSESAFRAIPPKGEHSIAWILFHITRIEDITINMRVANSPQVYTKNGWAKKLRATIPHSANRMNNSEIEELSSALSMDALREYRVAVGRRTREVVKKIKPDEWAQPVQAERLHRVVESGAVTPEAMEIIHYWSKRTISGLLLMPPTRHNFLHLNEAMRVRSKLRGK